MNRPTGLARCSAKRLMARAWPCCCPVLSCPADYNRLLKYGDSLYRCKELKRAAMVGWVPFLDPCMGRRVCVCKKPWVVVWGAADDSGCADGCMRARLGKHPAWALDEALDGAWQTAQQQQLRGRPTLAVCAS